jgi:NAD(P)H-dependent flavin oxidoreductase YrpB (nitropropane dioxygenase family)
MNRAICGDNRFEIIEKAKQAILEETNIKDDKAQMAELDSFLFRCWQMGWLKKYEEKETNEGQALLYAVEKTAERTKREMVEKAVKWLDENVDNYCFNTGNRCEYIPKVGRKMLEDFKQAMQDESK